MRSRFLFRLIAFISFGVGLGSSDLFVTHATTPTPPAPEQILFDDFNYTAHDDPTLSENGWIVRTVEGWPGVPGAVWREENVAFVDDPDSEGNRLMQMTSSTDGEIIYQTQVCQQRKFLEGTYASRVHFSDSPTTGPDGDNMVETFYLMSTPELETDPDYSELDFEYLPNGGWGISDSVFFATTWETFQFEPWVADNTSDLVEGSFEGWHTLVIQIANDEANYYLDGEHFATHDSYYYPEVPMSINYNLWFINGGMIDSTEVREYVELVDWAFFAANVALSPEDVDTTIEALREEEFFFTDNVPQWEPPLESRCDL
jgi:hypothetical protein